MARALGGPDCPVLLPGLAKARREAGEERFELSHPSRKESVKDGAPGGIVILGERE